MKSVGKREAFNFAIDGLFVPCLCRKKRGDRVLTTIVLGNCLDGILSENERVLTVRKMTVSSCIICGP